MTNVIGTFFHKVKALAEKIFGSTKWEQTAQSVITYAAPLLTTIVGLAAGGPAAAIVTRVIGIVQADLATILAVSQGASVSSDASKATAVTTALNSIKENLSELLTAADVKNSGKREEITTVATLLINEADAMLQNLPAASPAPASPAPVPAPAAPIAKSA